MTTETHSTDTDSTLTTIGDPDGDYVARDIRHVAETLGRTPKLTEYTDRGEVSHRAVYHRWDSWDEALTAAGLEPPEEPRGKAPLDRETVAADVRRVATIVGGFPTAAEYKNHGKYTYTTVCKKFPGDNGWLSVRKAVVED
jgi:hypothetical protein